MQEGIIYSFTVIHSPMESFKGKTPYLVALVEHKQERLFTRIDDYREGQEVYVGMHVYFSHFDERGQPYKFLSEEDVESEA